MSRVGPVRLSLRPARYHCLRLSSNAGTDRGDQPDASVSEGQSSERLTTAQRQSAKVPAAAAALRGLRDSGKQLKKGIQNQVDRTHQVIWEETGGHDYVRRPERGTGATGETESQSKSAEPSSDCSPSSPNASAVRPARRLRDIGIADHVRIWRDAWTEYKMSWQPPTPDKAAGGSDDAVFSSQERQEMKDSVDAFAEMARSGKISAQELARKSPELRQVAEQKLAVVKESMGAFVEGYRVAKDEAMSTPSSRLTAAAARDQPSDAASDSESR